MPRYVAFLRGINVGRRRPPMAQLRELFASWGHRDVATFIASGNVIFSSSARSDATLATHLAERLEAALGYDVPTYVRRAEEVTAIASQPALEDDLGGVSSVQVTFLHEPLPPELAGRLEAIRTPLDEFRVHGREYYWRCRTKLTESTVWARPELRALRLPAGTMRNLTSIRKLATQHLAGE